MRNRRSWCLKLAGLLVSGTMLYQIGLGGCAQGTSGAVFTSFDSCWLFDCVNGAAGGLFSFCGDPNSTLDDMFLDCPGNTGVSTGTGTGAGTGTGTNQTGTGQTTGGLSGLGGFGG